MTEQDPFGREELLDEPGILGARWWQRSLRAAPDVHAGRRAVLGLLAGITLASIGISATSTSTSTPSAESDDFRTEARPALDVQKEYGWSFGATAETLTFDGQSTRPFARDALATLAVDLRPAHPAHLPWYVPTLFQSPAARARSAPVDDPTPAAPLADVLQPIFTPAMNVAYRRGRALAALFLGSGGAAMVVVDLPGPESVAFAAGAAAAFDAVFALDNWPHPRGVVPAHQTLAAAAYYQPLFARHAVTAHPSGGGAPPPMLVLDRRRLDPYTDASSEFDNRHLARVPGAPALQALGLRRVLYVAPAGTDKELDDLNDDFVRYAGAGLAVRLVGADAFGPDPADGAGPPSGPDDDRPVFYYGSSKASSGWFWHDYPWLERASPGKPPAAKLAGVAYAPAPRVTSFSGGSGSTGRLTPSGFGTVPVVVSIATGLVLGARLFRSGSWNRSSGGWGG